VHDQHMQFVEYAGSALDDIQMAKCDRVERPGDDSDPVHASSVAVNRSDARRRPRGQFLRVSVFGQEVAGDIVQSAGQRVAQRRMPLQFRIGVEH
jgi:hypothetical protein